jgi:8-oxo-dGTP pyrophosphatase MutT (NUDIX family)
VSKRRILNTGATLGEQALPRRFPNDPAAWQAFDTTYLHKRPPWLVLRQQRFCLPTGGEIAEYWISEYPPWINVVAVTPDDQVVMLRQYRPGIEDVHYEIPAGVVEPGEELEAAARRELAEETGFGGGRWSLLTQLSANPALQDNITTTYLAEGVRSLGQARPEATEDLRVHLVPIDDVASLIDSGDMIQALHVAPLLRYLLRRRG